MNVDRPKLTEQKTILIYSSSPTKVGRNNNIEQGVERDEFCSEIGVVILVMNFEVKLE